MIYFAITYTKVHHKLTQEQRDTIMSTDFDRMEMPDGSMLTNNNISDLLPEEKYYQTFPDKRPEEVRDDFQKNYGGYNQQIRKPTTRAKELMTQGFLKCRMEVFGETEEEARVKFKDFKLFKI